MWFHENSSPTKSTKGSGEASLRKGHDRVGVFWLRRKMGVGDEKEWFTLRINVTKRAGLAEKSYGRDEGGGA